MTDQPITRQSEWQPIATAPRDETPILGVWQADDGEWIYDVVEWAGHAFVDSEYLEAFCTHWMPLPTPPAMVEERE